MITIRIPTSIDFDWAIPSTQLFQKSRKDGDQAGETEKRLDLRWSSFSMGVALYPSAGILERVSAQGL